MKKQQLRNIIKEEILNELDSGEGWGGRLPERPKHHNDNKPYYRIIDKVLHLFEEEQKRSPEPEGDFFVYLRDLLNRWKPSSSTTPSDFEEEQKRSPEPEGDFDPDETDYSHLSA